MPEKKHNFAKIIQTAVEKIAYNAVLVEDSKLMNKKLNLKFKGIIDKTLIPQIQAEIDSKLKLKKTTIIINDIDYEDRHSIIKFSFQKPITPSGSDLEGHQKSKTTKKLRTNKLKTPSGSDLEGLKNKALKEIQNIKSKQLNALQIKYLGRKGIINQLTQSLKNLPPEQKAQQGKQINTLKTKIIKALDSQKSNVKGQKSDWLDVTSPGTLPPQGHLHPISLAIEEIARIFTSIGFTRVNYPEIDWDYYVFESLNMPQDHPARDEWETFFINLPSHPQKGSLVLTPHTSSGQVREMERVKKPPIRMINFAKCYRRQQDVSHTVMFHQFEGLCIDRGINIQHLKGTIEYFAQKFYGPNTQIRLRPFNFTFTEPSFEVDFLCTICHGKGKIKNKKCKLCKVGWLEVAGAGMVHPNVLRFGGINPNKYTGWAFGMGVERAYTLKPGLQLDDIRPFYSNNLDFLNQF